MEYFEEEDGLDYYEEEDELENYEEKDEERKTTQEENNDVKRIDKHSTQEDIEAFLDAFLDT